MNILPNGKPVPLTDAERAKRYRERPGGKETKRRLESERRARKRQALVLKMSKKSRSRDLHRFVEHMAGTPEAQRRRDQRVRLAEERRLATGSPRPKRPDPNRGGKGFRKTSFATEGHSIPLSRTEYSPAHKEGSVFYQSRPANYGKGGQGSKTLREWDAVLRRKGLMLHPARPTEITKIISKIVPLLP